MSRHIYSICSMSFAKRIITNENTAHKKSNSDSDSKTKQKKVLQRIMDCNRMSMSGMHQFSWRIAFEFFLCLLQTNSVFVDSRHFGQFRWTGINSTIISIGAYASNYVSYDLFNANLSLLIFWTASKFRDKIRMRA